MESDYEEDETVQDLSNPDVTTKYRCAGDIVNEALAHCITLCVEGADIVDICEAGDKIIEEKVAGVYNKKEKSKTDPKAPPQKVQKGVAFPTCLSVNDVCGHFSPLRHDSRPLAAGDVAKIDLGCHIDGFIAVAAHTVIVGDGPFTGRSADVVLAAHAASEAAMRLVQVGKTNTMVTDMMNKCTEAYKCNMLEGVLSHQMKKHVIDGNQVIISKETSEQKVDEFEFNMNEVYAVDVMVSSGEGKARESEFKCTVFKRAVETSYSLKSPLARQFLADVNRRFPTLPFTSRAIEEDKVRAMGVSESLRHELLHPYPVLVERPEEFVAQFKFTVLLLPGGAKRITGLPFAQQAKVQSEFTISDPDVQKLLASSANPKKNKKKKAKERTKTEEPETAADEK